MDLERVRDLERLGTLHARGVLDDEEFAAAKAQVLARPDAAPVARRGSRPMWVLPVVISVALVLVAVVAAVALSRGGPDRLSVTEYEDAVNEAHRDAVATIAQERLRPSDVRAAVEALTDELDELEPPEEGDAGHEQLVDAYREHVDTIDDLVALVAAATDAATDPSRADAVRAGLSLLGSGRSIIAARRDLDAAHDALADEGIDVVTLANPGALVRELA